MKWFKYEILFFALMLASCAEEEETVTKQPTIGDKVSYDAYSQSYTSVEVKNILYDFANETLSNMYQTQFNPEDTRLLSKEQLLTWIKQNEKNKTAAINKENRRLLKLLLQKDDIKALMINTPNHTRFQQSVYILIPKEVRAEDFKSTGAVLITDANSNSSDSGDNGDTDNGGEDDGDNGDTDNGGEDDGGDDEEEEEEKVCYYQSGTYLDARSSTSDNFSGCPPCLVECVDCNDYKAGVDDCINCKV